MLFALIKHQKGDELIRAGFGPPNLQLYNPTDTLECKKLDSNIRSLIRRCQIDDSRLVEM